MADITSKIAFLKYRGVTKSITSLPNVNKIKAIYRVNEAGEGFISYRKGSSFPALQTLDNDIVYQIVSSEVPYTIETESEGSNEPPINIEYQFNSNFFQ